MSATTTYRLPTADDLAWVEDLIATVENDLDEIRMGLAETKAEGVTLDDVGRMFLHAQFVRRYAEGFTKHAKTIEDAVVELRQAQETAEEDGPFGESYFAFLRRQAHRWAEGAESAAERLASVEAQREASDAR